MVLRRGQNDVWPTPSFVFHPDIARSGWLNKLHWEHSTPAWFHTLVSHFHRLWSFLSLVAWMPVQDSVGHVTQVSYYVFMMHKMQLGQFHKTFSNAGVAIFEIGYVFCDEYCTYIVCPLNETLINNMIQNLKVCGMSAKLNVITKSTPNRKFQILCSTFPCQIPFMSSNILLSECFQISAIHLCQWLWVILKTIFATSIREYVNKNMKNDTHISKYFRTFHYNFTQKMSKLIRSFTKSVVANLLIIFGTEENMSPQLKPLTKDSLLLKNWPKPYFGKPYTLFRNSV